MASDTSEMSQTDKTATVVNVSMGPMSESQEKAANPKVYKYFSLVALTFQNAALTLIMRYVRTRQGDMFHSSTAVIMSELLKCTACLGLIFVEEGSVRGWLRHLHENIWKQPMDCLKISVPSIVYVLQNNLLYVAISNLDAATFQVTYQLKLLTTALFSVIMLNKHLSRVQWFALFLLFAGVSAVQLQPEVTKAEKVVATEQNPLVGLIAVSVSCIMSGFAGVYFEKILKGTQQTLWLRNVQLGFLGVFFGLMTMEVNDGDKVREHGFFYGYDWVVWVVIAFQAFGGLMVAMVVKYADNILKGFATSGAIVVACVASVYLFNFQVSLQFAAGSSLVMMSIYLYSRFVPAAATSVGPAPVLKRVVIPNSKKPIE